MRDKWRRMTDRELRDALQGARQQVEASLPQLNPSAPLLRERLDAEIDEIASELSRREITRFTAVAAWAAVIGVIVGLVAAVAALWPLFKD